MLSDRHIECHVLVIRISCVIFIFIYILIYFLMGIQCLTCTDRAKHMRYHQGNADIGYINKVYWIAIQDNWHLMIISIL